MVQIKVPNPLTCAVKVQLVTNEMLQLPGQVRLECRLTNGEQHNDDLLRQDLYEPYFRSRRLVLHQLRFETVSYFLFRRRL